MIKNIRACNGTGVAQCVILAILLVLLSSMLVFVGLSTDNNIAYADNGIVNDNLVTNNDFSSSDGYTASYFTSYSFDNGFNFVSSSWSALEYKPVYNVFELGTTYTISFSLNNTLHYYSVTIPNSYPSSDTNLDNGWYNFTNGDLRIYYTSGYNYHFIPTFDFLNNSSGTLNWFKIELGSSFTGYVPKDYKNYGYDQGLIDFDYPIFEYVNVTTLNGGVGVNLDSSYMATNIVDQNASLLRVYAVNNTQASYSPYVPCAFYYDFTNTIVQGSFILFDFNFNVQFNGTQRIYYKFAPLNTSLSSEDVNSYPDGYFDNNSTGVRIMCPIESTRIYFCVRVNQTSSFSGAGGLTYYYLYSCSRQIGDTIYSSVLPLDTDYLNKAYDRGYANGKADGIVIGQNEQPYSFKGLFSAIYSVPINAFNNMFNFDVFGVNMRTFILGMITFALALFVWKIIVRGG